MKKAPKAPKQVTPILANRHYDKAIEQQIEARAAELYPTGCHVLFTREQAYVMPTDWYAGPGYALPYSGEKRRITIEDISLMKKGDLKPDPDPFGWLRSN